MVMFTKGEGYGRPRRVYTTVNQSLFQIGVDIKISYQKKNTFT